VRLSRSWLWGLGGAAAAVGIALVPLIATADFQSERGLWIALDLVIGAGFAGVGLFAWYRAPENRVGALMVATAFAWYLSLLERTEPSLLFTLGILFENLFVATAIHLLLAFPSGRLERSFDRVLVGFSYLTTTVGFLPFVLFADPLAAGCTACPQNLLLIESDPSFALTWLDVLAACGITLLLAVLVRLGQRWRGASAPLRRAVTPVFVTGGALLAGLAAALLIANFIGASHTVKETIYYSTLFPFALVPYVFLAGLVKSQVLRGRGLGALVRQLGAGPALGELRPVLAKACGDPTVEVAYWLPDSEQYVDAEGNPVTLPPPGSSRAVTEVDRDGRRIAAIIHEPTLLEDREHVRAVGAAAALALENERLEAELRAKVQELRASRSAMVEVGLRERRRLERDLHDGAQQRLVSIALTLRLAQERLASEPDEAERMLDWSREELEEALKDLRELARGIHPAVLSDRGLGAAIEALASRAPVPVEIGELPADRLPEHVELAAYFVVSEALTNVAKYAANSQAKIAVNQINGRLEVEVADDGPGGADPQRGSGLRGLAARLATIEGRLEVDSPPGGGTKVRARIPWGQS
jgi:signal transduction histidine kinase